MNLTASNAVMWPLKGDIGALPHVGQWRSIVLEGEMVLVWSWKDMKGCFYLFRLPSAWAPLFAFDEEYTAEELGVNDLPAATKLWLGSVTVPMGFLNAMSIIQYAHRRMHILRGGLVPRSLDQAGGHPSHSSHGATGNVVKTREASGHLARELRKDHPAPLIAPNNDDMHYLWQVYCDDFDTPEVFTSPEVAKEMCELPFDSTV